MTSLKDFFIFCSGANRSILKRTPTEINKYVSIGATIFFTGVFAAIAAGYALYTVFDSYLLVVPIALLWGFMIFNLDRFIVSTMKKKGSFSRDFAGAAPRLILAILIAVVIAKPLELKIFESEIQAELVQMQQENYKKQDDLVRSRYTLQVDTLKSEILALKSEIDTKANERDRLVNEAIMEADGTGGSMNKNLGPIYKTKRTAADLVQVELDKLTDENSALIATKQNDINVLESQMKGDMSTLERVTMSGFAARLEGLERATERSRAIYIASIFIMLLFIAIELAPVITKLMLERSPYDYVLDKHETVFAANHKAFTSREILTVENEARFNQEISDHKTKLAIDAEKELADEAVKRKIEELKGRTTLSRGFFKESSLFEG